MSIVIEPEYYYVLEMLVKDYLTNHAIQGCLCNACKYVHQLSNELYDKQKEE